MNRAEQIKDMLELIFDMQGKLTVVIVSAMMTEDYTFIKKLHTIINTTCDIYKENMTKELDS